MRLGCGWLLGFHPGVPCLEWRKLPELGLPDTLADPRWRTRWRNGQRHCRERQAASTGVYIRRPIGFLGGVYLAEFGGRSFSFVIRYTADLLNGVPSIVMGIFAYTIVVLPMKHFSALAGGLALGVMMIPIAVRSTEEALRTVPLVLREGALALGASKWKTVATVVVPAARKGIVTGIILDIARVAGETAPLLFTALNNQFWSPGWNQPIASLPVMVYTYAISPYDDWHKQAWAGGLVLLTLVLAANVVARLSVSGRSAH